MPGCLLRGDISFIVGVGGGLGGGWPGDRWTAWWAGIDRPARSFHVCDKGGVCVRVMTHDSGYLYLYPMSCLCYRLTHMEGAEDEEDDTDVGRFK